MAHTFVGESRKALAEGILDCYDNLTDPLGNSRACWISLEAPSGWGKTRVAQEVYRRLAARQDRAYWPPDIVGTFDVDTFDVAGRRKRVYPSLTGFDREPGALPDFFWWGIGCDVRSSLDPAETLLEDLRQLETHAPYLEASWSAATAFELGRYASLTNGREAIRAVIEEVGDEGFESVAEALLNTALPGIGLAKRLGLLGLGKAKKNFESRLNIKSGGALDGGNKVGLVEDTVSLLSRIATPFLPVLIFVEDLHRASEPVLQLLENLLRYNAPILIVSSTWPGEFRKLERLVALETDTWVGDRVFRIRHDRPVPPRFPRQDASLSQLGEEALKELVFGLYPDADAETARRLSVRYQNPLPIELVLSMKRNVRNHPRLLLAPEEIAQLPRSVRRLYEQLWDELPEDVQSVLSLVTLAMPDDDPVWMEPLIESAIRRLNVLENSEALANLLGRSAVPHGWARVVSNALRSFGEVDQLDVARDAVEDQFGQDEQNAFLKSLAAEVAKRDWINPENPEHRHMAWICLALKNAGLVDEELTLKATHLLMQYISKQPLMLRTGIRLTDQFEKVYAEPGSIEDPKICNILFFRANCLEEIGEMAHASELISRILNEGIRLLGADHPTTLTIRSSRASLFGQAGRVPEAIEAFENLLIDLTRVLGREHAETLKTRSNLASFIGRAGRVEEAVMAFKELLQDHTRFFGADHPDTMTTRNNLAHYLGQTGRVAESVGAFEMLLKDHTRILGQDHIDTLSTRHNLAYFLGQMGRTAEAIVVLKALLEDHTRVLGPDHPNTQMVQNNLALCLGQAGRIDETVEVFKQLLDNRTRVLGLEHPHTLMTRNNLAFSLAKAGRVAEVIETYEELLEDYTRVLGPEHSDTLTTRNNIAYLLGKGGQPDEAVIVFDELLEVQTRVHGLDHPDTLSTRVNLAMFLGQTGRVAEAFDAFEQLLKDCTRVLGPEHPKTLNSRSHLALLLGEMGQVDEAVAAIEQLLEDMIRVHGRDHMETLSTRPILAYLLVHGGKLDEAVSVFKKLLKDCIRVIGPDHPNTLAIRNSLADLLRR